MKPCPGDACRTAPRGRPRRNAPGSVPARRASRAWFAVALVLLDSVVHRLLGQAVLQLEGGDRQAVDEQAQVQGKLGLVAAVAQLPGDAEAVLPIEDLGTLSFPGDGVP